MSASNKQKVELVRCLKELRLAAAREQFEPAAEKARKENLSYEQYLWGLLEHECDVRRQHRVAKYLRDSKLPLEKNLKTFDMKRLPQKVESQVQPLLDGWFLSKKENILAFGKPGSGKSHLLCAIGQELVQRGHRVFFSTCSFLVQELLAAKKELKLAAYIKKLGKYEALIIDDIGYVQQNREEMEVLFTLLAERYERGTVMLTSNLPFSQWEQIFKDPMTTAAAIDRLVHHSIILELNLSSYRLEQSKKNKKEKS